MKLALLVKYIGTSFEGFQAQPSGNTVQQHLTSAVSGVFGFPCNVTGCSRTDSGVHALGYVASVSPADPDMMTENWCTIPPERFHRAITPYLHADIAVTGAVLVEDSFHPRYSSSGKEYVYLMKDSPDTDPFLKGRVWQLRRTVSHGEITRMNDIASSFIGKHDFRAFMSQGSSVTDTVRTVTSATVEQSDRGIIKFTVSADGFLYNMVRIMTGTLISVLYDADIDIEDAFNTGDRSLLGMTAPPDGLYLNRVFYECPPEFKCK